MNLKKISKNATELKLNDYLILYSYSIPVVAIDRKTKKTFVTNQFISHTTKRHIESYLLDSLENLADHEKVDQSFLNKIVGEK